MLLKEQIKKNKLPAWLNPFSNTVPHSVNSLLDTQLRQRLYDRQDDILREHGKWMSDIVLSIYETKFNESQQAFDTEMARMWQNQRMLPFDKRLTQAMIDIMDLRLALIKEKIEYIYTYKIQQISL